jgi:hypothetical protein
MSGAHTAYYYYGITGC